MFNIQFSFALINFQVLIMHEDPIIDLNNYAELINWCFFNNWMIIPLFQEYRRDLMSTVGQSGFRQAL